MNYAEAGLPINRNMFIYEGILGKLSWDPSPEIIEELRNIADICKNATTPEERTASAATFQLVYQCTARMYLELLALSFFGTKDGKTNVPPFCLIRALRSLQDEVHENGLISPEMARVISKAVIRKLREQ